MKKILVAATIVAFTATTPTAFAATKAKNAGLIGGVVAGAVVGGPVGAVIGGVAGYTVGKEIDKDKRRQRR